MSDEANELEVTRGTIVARGLFCGCPNCGEHGLLKHWFKLNRKCTGCGLDLEKSDGFYSGTTSIGYVGAIVLVVVPVIILVLRGTLSVNQGIAACIGGSALFILLIYPLTLGWMVMTYYFTMPGELPENGGANTVDKHL